MAKGSNFLTMGKKNVLRFFFFRRFPLIMKFTDPAQCLLKPLPEGDLLELVS